MWMHNNAHIELIKLNWIVFFLSFVWHHRPTNNKCALLLLLLTLLPLLFYCTHIHFGIGQQETRASCQRQKKTTFAIILNKKRITKKPQITDKFVEYTRLSVCVYLFLMIWTFSKVLKVIKKWKKRNQQQLCKAMKKKWANFILRLWRKSSGQVINTIIIVIEYFFFFILLWAGQCNWIQCIFVDRVNKKQHKQWLYQVFNRDS